MDNTVICHTILQDVPIKREPLSSFSKVLPISYTYLLIFSFTLCQHKLIVVLQVNFFYYPVLSPRACNEFIGSNEHISHICNSTFI